MFHSAGSILEGPNSDTLKPIVESAMSTLLDLLKDSCVVVRDTAAWTVGRICEILPEAVINDHYLNPLLHAMVEGLNAEPRVAANVCWVGFLSIHPYFSATLSVIFYFLSSDLCIVFCQFAVKFKWVRIIEL